LYGSACGGAWVVQLVHEACGERSQRHHFFLLYGHALHFLETLRHVGQDGLADLWATGHQAPELLLVELQQTAWHRCLEIHAVGDVCQKG